MNETQTKPAHLGGGYLKTGQFKALPDGKPQHWKCQVSARNGGARVVPAHGNFGAAVEIPIEVDGVKKVVSLPEDSGDIQALRAIYGPESEWAGKTIDVYESSILDIIRVVPVP